ncbi:30S ribosomal protein S4e [Candidatus Woesearchaeota archaeon]|nr:30S ribosomal protein S4e [Candidatus Woesearchaeota archaeon]
MVKQHLKRLASPRTWPISKKTLPFVARPHPGPNNKYHHLPLTVVLRDLIKVANTTKEVKFILHNKDCLIDGRAVHDNKQPVGLFGVVSLPKVKEYYRLTITQKSKLAVVKVDDKEASQKVCKIIGKTALRKGKMQLNLIDGRNVLVDKDTYKVGDSLIVDLPSQKIINHLALQKGALIFLESGSHVGKIAVIESIEASTITVKIDNVLFKTKKESVVVVGKEKSLITVQ